MRQRIKFLEITARNPNISAARLEATIRRLRFEDSLNLVRFLVRCSIARFERYLQVCSVDRSEPVHDQHGKQKFIKDPYYVKELEWQISESSSETTDSETTLSFETASETASEPMDPKFCELIHNLPPELFLQIQEEFFNSTFGPRAVHPYDELVSTRVFQALNKRLLAKYRRIFYSQNTWIIGQGDYDDAVEFLDRIPPQLVRLIRKVKMAFKTHDFIHSSLNAYFDPSQGNTSNVLEILLGYRTQCICNSDQLMKNWIGKFWAVLFFRLESFVLDLSDAYAPDGTYLGLHIAWHMPRFAHGLPGSFTVGAPTRALAEEILNIFKRNNPRKAVT